MSSMFELFKNAVELACEYLDDDSKIEYRQKAIEMLEQYMENIGSSNDRIRKEE